MNVEIASFFLGTHGEIISADLTKMSGTKMTFVLFFPHRTDSRVWESLSDRDLPLQL